MNNCFLDLLWYSKNSIAISNINDGKGKVDQNLEGNTRATATTTTKWLLDVYATIQMSCILVVPHTTNKLHTILVTWEVESLGFPNKSF